jgi:hypothetical protein
LVFTDWLDIATLFNKNLVEREQRASSYGRQDKETRERGRGGERERGREGEKC